MAKHKEKPQLPYDPTQGRTDPNKRYTSPKHKHGKRKVWLQKPGDAISNGLRIGMKAVVVK